MNLRNLFLGMFVLVAFVTNAQSALTWQRLYEADKIPEETGSIEFTEGGSSEWTLSKTGSPELNYVSAGVFHHEYPNRSGRRGWLMGTDTSGDGDSRWDASAQTTFEMRAQMIQDCDGAGADWYFADGDNYYTLNFKVDSAVALGGDTVPLDLTSDFFTVRVAIDGPSDTLTAYFIDAGSNEATLSIPVRGAIERNYVFFSGITSTADVPIEMEIDYMRWTNEGAFDFSTEINPPNQGSLAGDLNSDGFVGGDDLDIVRSFWGQNVTAGDLLQGDPSNDGFVGGDDLDIVRANWGQGTPPAPGAVPEPSMFVLLLGALATIGIARLH